MELLDACKFVQGAVAKKDFVPELMHFRIKAGRISSYNGMLAMSCPIDLHMDIAPRAVQFVKAIQTCVETVSMHLTPTKRLAIKSGKFKCFVDCVDETTHEALPEGVVVPLNGGFLHAIKTLAPFIGEDASRPWARGILFKETSALATNNIILLEYHLGYNFPIALNVPRAAIMELIKVGEEPTSLQWTENNVTFHYPGDRWIRTQTYSCEWPDLQRILSKPSIPVAMPEGLWEAAETLVPFTDDMGRLFFTEGKVSTVQQEDNGASIDVPTLVNTGCYNHKHLMLLRDLVQTIDFSVSPAMFFGERVRGAIIGMRI